MKKILLYTALLCALIGINSCSLSMDEYIEEPDKCEEAIREFMKGI